MLWKDYDITQWDFGFVSLEQENEESWQEFGSSAVAEEGYEVRTDNSMCGESKWNPRPFICDSLI